MDGLHEDLSFVEYLKLITECVLMVNIRLGIFFFCPRTKYSYSIH